MSAPLALIAVFASSLFSFFTEPDTFAIMGHFTTSVLMITAVTLIIKIANEKTDAPQPDDSIEPRVHPLYSWSFTKLLHISPDITASDATHAAALLDASSRLRRWTTYDNKLLRRQVTSYEDVRGEKLGGADALFPVLVEMPMGGMQCAVM